MIKAIAFDFDDTLYEGVIWDGWFEYCKEAVRKFLGNLNDVKLNKILKKYKKSQLNSHDVVEILSGEGIDLERWNEHQRDSPFERDYSKARAIEDKKLREFADNYAIYCVTNNVPSDFARTAKIFKIDVSLFKKVLFNNCTDNDCSKYTRYGEILKIEKIQPHELMVVGNDFNTDIIPAQKLGAHTIHMYGPNFRIEDIRKIK